MRGGAGAAAARAAGRQRHPTAVRGCQTAARLIVRLAERAGRGGAPWPRVAAAVLLLRGVAGDDRPAFARRLGVPEAQLDRLERGLVPASGVPPRLRAVPDLVDWAWVDDASCQGFW